MQRHLLGGVLLLAGAALLGSWLQPQGSWQIERVHLSVPEQLVSHYPPVGFERLEANHGKTHKRLTAYLVHYRDASGTLRQALLPEPGSAKWRAWIALGDILRNLEPNAWVIAWWDNSQRVDFLSGRKVLARQPPRKAFAPEDRPLWQSLSGSFADTPELPQLANWWSADPKQALADLAPLESQGPIYLLVASDDLAHLEEIERLAGKTLPLEVKIFPTSGNLHAQIAKVKRWAQDKPYLPQPVPGGIAAWRLTKEPAPFLLQLLPFVPPVGVGEAIKRVYQSPGGYLTLYLYRR